MNRAYLAIAIASVSLAMPAKAAANADDPITDIQHVDHDATAVTHDAESVDRDVKEAESVDRDVKDAEKIGRDVDDADRETDSLFDDAERADGLLHDDNALDDHPHDDENTTDDNPDKLARDAEKAECDRLEFEYLLRHPPGTKPSGLRGLHGCALWRADARWHDEHPDVISVLGDNIFIGAKI
jgi:hypothetical protein